MYLLGSDYKNIIFIWRKQMKVSVIRPSSDEEDEIIIRCHTLSDDMDRLIHRLRYGEIKFTGYDEHGISTIAASDIYYFETVDNKVFAYCKQSVYKVKERLYQLEEVIEELPFMRISKSMIVNIGKNPAYFTCAWRQI